MAFKTKAEKRAFKIGLIRGEKKNPRAEPAKFTPTKPRYGNFDAEEVFKRKLEATYGKKQQPQVASKEHQLKVAPKKQKPIYDYSKDFAFNSKGRIKGSYTADGFFEPD